MAKLVRRAIVEALVKKSNIDEIVAYFCTHCGTVYKTKIEAERCSIKDECAEWGCECGNRIRWYYYDLCDECLNKRGVDRCIEYMKKKHRLVISWKEYPDQGVVFLDEYFDNIDDFVEHCRENEIDIPPMVWATDPHKFKIDPYRVIYDAFYEWSDGNLEADCMVGDIGLLLAIEDFNKAQTACLYFQSDNTVVSLEGIEEDITFVEIDKRKK
jgi:hypothetical protein